MPLAPKKINSYVLFDWETGGLDNKKNPVVELAMLAMNGTTLEEILRYDDLIKPYDDSLIYEPRALAVSGATLPALKSKGITLEELGENMIQVFTEANVYKNKLARPILIAHNAKFDRGFLQEVCRRLEIDLSQYVDGGFDPWGNFVPHVIDTIDWAKGLFAPKTENTTNFKFGSCCQRAGLEYVDGHKALNDVVLLADLWRYYLTRLRSGSSEVTVVEGRAVAAHRQNFEW